MSGPLVDEEMVEHVQEYVDTVRKLADGHTLLVEQRLRVLPDVWGTELRAVSDTSQRNDVNGRGADGELGNNNNTGLERRSLPAGECASERTALDAKRRCVVPRRQVAAS